MMSDTACSSSAELSTIITLMPPVSATSVAIAPSRAASARLIAWAVAVEPVKTTPATRRSLTSAPPTFAPSPGRIDSTPCGMPASCRKRMARAAISDILLDQQQRHRVAGDGSDARSGQ